METRSRFTLFLIFVAALTAATALQTPLAQTQTTQAGRIAHELINMRVGYVQKWTAPRPFVDVHVGKPEIADVTTGKTDRQLIINSKAPGETNILVSDAEGVVIADLVVRVTGGDPEILRATQNFPGRVRLYNLSTTIPSQTGRFQVGVRGYSVYRCTPTDCEYIDKLEQTSLQDMMQHQQPVVSVPVR